VAGSKVRSLEEWARELAAKEVRRIYTSMSAEVLAILTLEASPGKRGKAELTAAFSVATASLRRCSMPPLVQTGCATGLCARPGWRISFGGQCGLGRAIYGPLARGWRSRAGPSRSRPIVPKTMSNPTSRESKRLAMRSRDKRLFALEAYVESRVEEVVRRELEAAFELSEERLTHEEFVRVVRKTLRAWLTNAITQTQAATKDDQDGGCPTAPGPSAKSGRFGRLRLNDSI
jgi:hypothetical protein